MKTYLFFYLFLLISCENKKARISKNEAIEFAKAEFKGKYGIKIAIHEPFEIVEINDTIWLIKGKKIHDLGGVPSLEINNRTGKIIKISHGK